MNQLRTGGGIQQTFPSKSMLQYSLKIMKTTSGLQAHTDPPATCVRRCFATSGCNVFVGGVYLKHLKAPQDASANNGTVERCRNTGQAVREYEPPNILAKSNTSF